MKFTLLLIFLFISLPGFGQEEDELLNELEADRKQQVETAVKLHETNQKLKESLDFQKQLENLGYTEVSASSLLNKDVVALVKKSMKDSPLRKMPASEVKKLMLEKSQGSFMYDILADHPKLVDAFVAVLQDDKALPQAIGLFLRRDDLRIYFFIWIGLMIEAWLLKKIIIGDKWPKPRRFVTSVLISLMFTGISLTTFYKMFEEELSPGASILFDHWRRRNL